MEGCDDQPIIDDDQTIKRGRKNYVKTYRCKSQKKKKKNQREVVKDLIEMHMHAPVSQSSLARVTQILPRSHARILQPAPTSHWHLFFILIFSINLADRSSWLRQNQRTLHEHEADYRQSLCPEGVSLR